MLILIILLFQNPVNLRICRHVDIYGFRVLIVDRCFQSNRMNSPVPALFPWTAVTLLLPKSGLMLSVINYDFICWNTTTKSLLLCFSDYIVCNCWMRRGLQSLVFIILKWQWWQYYWNKDCEHGKDISVIILALNFILTKVQLLKCNMHFAFAFIKVFWEGKRRMCRTFEKCSSLPWPCLLNMRWMEMRKCAFIFVLWLRVIWCTE